MKEEQGFVKVASKGRSSGGGYWGADGDGGKDRSYGDDGDSHYSSRGGGGSWRN